MSVVFVSVAMDETRCKTNVRKCKESCRATVQEPWHNIFVKLEEYLLETSAKQRLAIVDVLWKYIVDLTRREGFSCQDDETYLLSLGSVLCTVYMCSLSNLRLCQRVKKVFDLLYKAKPQFVKSEIKKIIEEFLSFAACQHDVATLEKVCQLIDVCELGKKCVEELFVKFFFSVSCCLDTFFQELKLDHPEDDTSYNTEDCPIAIKAALKMFQYFPMRVYSLLHNEMAEFADGNTFETMARLVSNLFKILFCKTLSKECLFLCGTAVGLLLGVAVEKNNSVPIREIVAPFLLAAGVTCVQCHPVSTDVIMIAGIRVSLPASEYRPITQLAVVTGLLKSQKEKLLLAVDSETLQEVQDGKHYTITEGVLFQTIYIICKESKNLPVHYAAFEAMRQWLLWIQHSMKHHCYSWISCSDSYHTKLLLEIIWDNLEDSVEGVPALAIKLFSLLLELYKENENSPHKISFEEFYASLTDKAFGLPWHVKGRYGLICCLLPFVRLQEIIEKYPTLLDELRRCLSVNQLAPSSSNTFKALLESGRKGHEAGQRSVKVQTKFAEVWEKAWKAALLKALTSNERLVQQNACLYWLPCVLTCMPKSFNTLLTDLKGQFEGQFSEVNSPDKSSILGAYLAVLRAGRSMAVLKTCDLDEEFLSQGLNHLQDDIRATALSVIGLTAKTAEPLSALELKLLKAFLPHNLNTACASFRQTLFVSMKKILGRIRDSSLILVKQNYPLMNHGKSAEEPITNDSLLHELETMFEFVDWLFNLGMNCFFPGSSYQRQKTGIQLLVAVLDVFTTKWQPDKKKGQPSAACQTLVHLAQHFGYFSFFSPRNAFILCQCVESPFSDIREVAVKLLQEHFPWPLLLRANDSGGVRSAKLLIQKALNLAKSPKVQECESGATLFLLIHSKYVLELGYKFEVLSEVLEVTTSNSTASVDRNLSCAVRLFQQLLLELQSSLKAVRQDLGLASRLRPGHGLSLAIAQIIEVTMNQIKPKLAHVHELECWHQWQSTVQQTVDTAVNIIHVMLGVVSGSQESDTVCGASYAVIGEALNEMISSSLTMDDDDHTSEPQSVQLHRDLVMSCCWLHIKCACYLLGIVTEAAVGLENYWQGNAAPAKELISEGSLKVIAETAKGIIIQCRHQGVVQSCRNSFVTICRSLFRSSRSCLRHLPKQWLDQLLSTISSSASFTSVTRRSAGLPVVFTCVLSCEPSSNQSALLKQCMENLLITAQIPLPGVIDQHKDLPQVHAINILKALYQDTSLGPSVLQFAQQGTIVAVAGFGSLSWAVRNASMQLFGSVVNRMLGQKKGIEGDNDMNTISSRDFFTSYPALHEFFLNHLRGEPDSESSIKCSGHFSKPELFPILTLLSKLHPCSKADKRSSRLLVDFVSAITSLSSCPVYAVRCVAAKALAPFIFTEGLLDKVHELVSLLPDHSQLFSQNFLHGTLLQIHVLLDTVKWPVSQKHCRLLSQKFLVKKWIGTHENPCCLTRASFLSILLEFGLSLAAGSESDLGSLRTFLRDSVATTNNILASSLAGKANLQRLLVRISLELQLEKEHILSKFLSSSDHEQRLSALQYIHSLLSRKDGHCLLSQSTVISLGNLLQKETNQSCLLLAADVFVELFSKLDPCALPYQDLRNLWERLASFVSQSRGVSFVGKAVVVCSALLNQAIKMGEEEAPLYEMLTFWCKFTEGYCNWDKDEQLRFGAVRGLKLCGVTVLSYVLRCRTVKRQEHSSVDELAISVLRSTLSSLQDEEETIRKSAAEFVALIPDTTGSPQPKSVTCSVATGLLFQIMVQSLWSAPECWVTMETLIRGQHAIEVVIKDYARARQMLFEQEDSNLYAEPVLIAKLAASSFKVIIKKVLSLDNADKATGGHFSRWFSSACERLADDLRALRNSGLEDFGSLPNPRPFTARYRVLCLVDVLLCVTQSGETAHFFGKEIARFTEELVPLAKELAKAGDTSHPWLVEIANKLMGFAQEARHVKV